MSHTSMSHTFRRDTNSLLQGKWTGANFTIETNVGVKNHC